MAESEDVNMLKRRGRRRLVGAIALVLAAVIVLPMVFDPEPRGSAPPINVRIPGEEDSAFVPKVTVKKALEKTKPAAEASSKALEKAPGKAEDKIAEVPAEKAAPSVPDAPVEQPAPKIEIVVKKAAEKPAPAPAPAPAPVQLAERAKAEAALAGEQFIVPAGAYGDPSGVIDKLKAAKIPYYTEPIATKAGTVTRVRAGPFASRDAADRVQQQLKDLGLKPGNVAQDLEMTWLDYAVVGVFAVSVLVGAWRGLVREVISILGWVIAFLAANLLAGPLGPAMPQVIPTPEWRVATAYAVVFIGSLILTSLAGLLLSKVVNAVGLGGADRVLGSAFGAARGLLIVLAAALIAGLTSAPRQDFWRGSASGPWLVQAVDLLKPLLPQTFAERLRYD